MFMRDLIDYIVKNKYVIICIAVVVVLYALGIVDFLIKFFVLVALIIAAIWIGKKMQDNEGHLKDFFSFNKFRNFKDNVYYYQENKKNKE